MKKLILILFFTATCFSDNVVVCTYYKASGLDEIISRNDNKKYTLKNKNVIFLQHQGDDIYGITGYEDFVLSESDVKRLFVKVEVKVGDSFLLSDCSTLTNHEMFSGIPNYIKIVGKKNGLIEIENDARKKFCINEKDFIFNFEKVEDLELTTCCSAILSCFSFW